VKDRILPKFLLKNRFSTARQEIYRFTGKVLFYRTIPVLAEGVAIPLEAAQILWQR